MSTDILVIAIQASGSGDRYTRALERYGDRYTHTHTHTHTRASGKATAIHTCARKRYRERYTHTSGKATAIHTRAAWRPLHANKNGMATATRASGMVTARLIRQIYR